MHEHSRPNEGLTGYLAMDTSPRNGRYVSHFAFVRMFPGGVQPWAQDRLEVSAVRDMAAKIYSIIGLCQHLETELVWYSSVVSRTVRLEITTEVVK